MFLTLPGVCPWCEQSVTTLRGHGLNAQFGGRSFKAVAYICPNPMCQKVLGCEMDPIALKTDIVNEVSEQILEQLKDPLHASLSRLLR